MAQQVLRNFADHTRMSDAERANTSGVAQRYLALHVDQAPRAAVYAFVASDYQALELRTYSPPLDVAYTKQELDVETLKFICKNNLNKPHEVEGGVYEAFRKAVLPRPVGEEQWRTLERPDQWKELAYFLGSPHMVESIYHDPKTTWSRADNAEAYAIMDHMKQVGTFGASNQMAVAKEIGIMISNIVLPIGLLNLSEKQQRMSPRAAIEAAERPKVIEIKLAPEESLVQVESLRLRLEGFRKRTGLPATVETKRLVKQLLFSLAEAPIGASQVKATLGPFQKDLPKVEPEEQKLAAEYIDSQHWEQFHPNDSKRAQAIATICIKSEWTARELMKHAIMPHMCLNNRLLNKYQQTGVANEMDVEFLDAIASL